jgi:hypothetical protein
MMDKNKTSTNPNKERKSTMNETLTRDNLRVFAREMNSLGIKDVQGYILTGKTKEELLESCEDAVREVYIAKLEKVYENGFLVGAAKEVWAKLSQRHRIAPKKAPKEDAAPEKKSIDQVACEAKAAAAPKPNKVGQGTGEKSQRSPKGAMWTWLRERLERCSASQEVLLTELAACFPHVTEHTLKVFLYGARDKTHGWNKSGIEIAYDAETKTFSKE